MKPPLKRFLTVFRILRSEVSWANEVFMFFRWVSAISLLDEETTKRIVVSKPGREHLSSIRSNSFGSVLKVAFSGLASFFFVEET